MIISSVLGVGFGNTIKRIESNFLSITPFSQLFRSANTIKRIESGGVMEESTLVKVVARIQSKELKEK